MERIYGLLGRTLQHSWSVPIHQMLGNRDYRLIEVEPEELSDFLRQPGIGGLNVTMPYKRTIMRYCDKIDSVAAAIGSVNTLVRREEGSLCAYNTDAAGFAYLANRAGVDFSGRKVLILGSGGASLTVQAVTRRLKARQIVVISRRGENNYRNLGRHADAEIIVNATPVGMYPETGTAAIDLRNFSHCRAVLDLIYNPRRTALLLQAEALEIPCSDGLPMLVMQAVKAEEFFTGRPITELESERILKHLRRDKTNIVLIGMPGCGKTTVGNFLSQRTGRKAVDIDAEIERRAGCSIAELFAQKGEKSFRSLERNEIARQGQESGNILITGGGAVKDPKNYAALHQNGRIYHLERRIEWLARTGRPLSEQGDLSAMYANRLPLYRDFRDVRIDNNGSVKDAAAAVWRDFCEYSGN